MNIFDNLLHARTLPPGHTGLKAAKAAVDREYVLSRELEGRYRKIFHRRRVYSLDATQARAFTNALCDLLGQPRLRRQVFRSSAVHAEAGGHYCRSEIHWKYDHCGFTDLIHELTHYCGESGHGPAFVALEEFIFQTVVDNWTILRASFE